MPLEGNNAPRRENKPIASAKQAAAGIAHLSPSRAIATAPPPRFAARAAS
jgi:hypothetical protein